MSDIKNLIEKLTDFNNKSEKEISEIIKLYIGMIFEHAPEIKTIGWCQGTPTFNDGDPCEFTIYEIVYHDFNRDDIERLVSDKWEDHEYIEDYYLYEPYMIDEKSMTETGKKYFDKLCDMIYNDNVQPFMEKIYGNGVMVEYTKNEQGEIFEYLTDWYPG